MKIDSSAKTLTLQVECGIIPTIFGPLVSKRIERRDRLIEQWRSSESRFFVMIRFDVSALTKARLGTSLTLHLNTGPQALTDLKVDSLRGTIQAIRVQGGLLIRGSVDTQMDLDCVRCLESFVVPVTLELEETFRLAGASPTPDAPYAVSGDGWIDLAPLLRELVWVSIPLKPVCNPDCKGLCPQCGANLNTDSCSCRDTHVDPRWALLKDLL